jgi:hypothetical protein
MAAGLIFRSAVKTAATSAFSRRTSLYRFAAA